MIIKEISLKTGDFAIIDTKKDFNNKHFLNKEKQQTSQKAFDNYLIEHYKTNKNYCKYRILAH